MTQPDENTAPRCQYRTPSGRQCRLAAAEGDSLYCPRHSVAESGSDNLSKVLALGDKTLQSVSGVHHALSRVFTLLAEDRISARRAAVLAYVGGLLLRNLTYMDSEKQLKAVAIRSLLPGVTWDMLRCPPPQTPTDSDSAGVAS